MGSASTTRTKVLFRVSSSPGHHAPSSLAHSWAHAVAHAPTRLRAPPCHQPRGVSARAALQHWDFKFLIVPSRGAAAAARRTDHSLTPHVPRVGALSPVELDFVVPATRALDDTRVTSPRADCTGHTTRDHKRRVPVLRRRVARPQMSRRAAGPPEHLCTSVEGGGSGTLTAHLTATRGVVATRSAGVLLSRKMVMKVVRQRPRPRGELCF